MVDVPAKRRFAQGNDVDRAVPHPFHRDYHSLRAIRRAVTDFVAAHGSEWSGGTVLDFGAGDCPYAAALAAAGATLVRADIDPTDPAVLPIDAAGRVPLPDGACAAVLSTQVLEHVPDPAGYLAEAFRLLRPGGLLLLTTHGAFILHRVPTDYRRWTVDGLRLELANAGFDLLGLTPRIGILATATHLRAITYGGLLRRLPILRNLRPLLYLWYNARMAVEDRLTPASVAEAHPELLVAVARRPSCIVVYTGRPAAETSCPGPNARGAVGRSEPWPVVARTTGRRPA